MAAVFDNRPDTEAVTLPSTRAHRANIGTWLAVQWPKVVIAFWDRHDDCLDGPVGLELELCSRPFLTSDASRRRCRVATAG
jgi:hypothetical protein